MQQKFWTKKKIVITVVVWLAAVASVFFGLYFWNNRVDYTAARESVASILDTKTTVEKFLDAEITSLDFTDEEKALIADFEGVLDKCEKGMKALKESSAMKDGGVKSKYDKIEEEFGSVAHLATAWNEVKMLTDLTDENLATLKKSTNEKISAFAKELDDYRKEVASFKQQYTENAKKSSSVIEAYGQLQLKGDEMSKKYSSLSLEDIIGVAKVDISAFYDKIEELNQYVLQK